MSHRPFLLAPQITRPVAWEFEHNGWKTGRLLQDFFNNSSASWLVQESLTGEVWVVHKSYIRDVAPRDPNDPVELSSLQKIEQRLADLERRVQSIADNQGPYSPPDPTGV